MFSFARRNRTATSAARRHARNAPGTGLGGMIEQLERRELLAVTTTNTTVPIVDMGATIPSLDETLSLDGKLHINRQTSDGGGAQISSVLFNPAGAAGVSDSGTSYVGTGATQRTTIVTPSDMTIVNNNNTFNLISQGAAENSTQHDALHTVTNADGVVVASVDRSRIVNESFPV